MAALALGSGKTSNAPTALVARLHAAARSGESVELRRLLAGGVVDANAREGDLTPLLAATAKNRLACSMVLLEHGANPNLQDREGTTPLHTAVHHCQRGLIALLIRKGADPNIKDHLGKVPLDYGGAGVSSMFLGTKKHRDATAVFDYALELRQRKQRTKLTEDKRTEGREVELHRQRTDLAIDVQNLTREVKKSQDRCTELCLELEKERLSSLTVLEKERKQTLHYEAELKEMRTTLRQAEDRVAVAQLDFAQRSQMVQQQAQATAAHRQEELKELSARLEQQEIKYRAEKIAEDRVTAALRSHLEGLRMRYSEAEAEAQSLRAGMETEANELRGNIRELEAQRDALMQANTRDRAQALASQQELQSHLRLCEEQAVGLRKRVAEEEDKVAQLQASIESEREAHAKQLLLEVEERRRQTNESRRLLENARDDVSQLQKQLLEEQERAQKARDAEESRAATLVEAQNLLQTTTQRLYAQIQAKEAEVEALRQQREDARARNAAREQQDAVLRGVLEKQKAEQAATAQAENERANKAAADLLAAEAEAQRKVSTAEQCLLQERAEHTNDLQSLRQQLRALEDRNSALTQSAIQTRADLEARLLAGAKEREDLIVQLRVSNDEKAKLHNQHEHMKDEMRDLWLRRVSTDLRST